MVILLQPQGASSRRGKTGWRHRRLWPLPWRAARCGRRLSKRKVVGSSPRGSWWASGERTGGRNGLGQPPQEQASKSPPSSPSTLWLGGRHLTLFGTQSPLWKNRNVIGLFPGIQEVSPWPAQCVSVGSGTRSRLLVNCDRPQPEPTFMGTDTGQGEGWLQRGARREEKGQEGRGQCRGQGVRRQVPAGSRPHLTVAGLPRCAGLRPRCPLNTSHVQRPLHTPSPWKCVILKH